MDAAVEILPNHLDDAPHLPRSESTFFLTPKAGNPASAFRKRAIRAFMHQTENSGYWILRKTN
jgi:hypothetical protein